MVDNDWSVNKRVELFLEKVFDWSFFLQTLRPNNDSIQNIAKYTLNFVID